ncbi:hypothetical protein GCM10022419_041140 [Nonomuraea rosea]|uniref:Uncharacterized protein n=1 Tax=Nonomuraea rosea TaxID=638574 RepID=A0ABP6WTH9_9ACTN
MRARTWIVAAVALPFALSGCAVPGTGRAPTAAPATTSAPAPGREPAQPTGSPTGSPGPDAGAVPVAAATFSPGAKKSAEVEVLALRRRGKLLDLVLSITAHSGDETYISVEDFTGTGPSAITLVDNVRLKRYLIVRDSAGALLQPPYWIIKADEASVRTYTFAAPPAEVTRLDVSIGGQPPFRDVPVTS